MAFDDFTTCGVAGSDRAVIGSLRSGVTVGREAERSFAVHDGVFLFEAEPEVAIVFEGAPDVRGMDGPIGVEHFAEHQRGVSSVGVGDDPDRLEQAVGRVAFGLFGRAAIEGPVGTIGRAVWFVVDDLRLAAQRRLGCVTVQPDVFQLIAHAMLFPSRLLLEIPDDCLSKRHPENKQRWVCFPPKRDLIATENWPSLRIVQAALVGSGIGDGRAWNGRRLDEQDVLECRLDGDCSWWSWCRGCGSWRAA